MGPPPRREVRRRTFRESCVIKNQPRLRSLLVELESHNRVKTWIPILLAPRLHDPLIGNQFKVPPYDHSSKNGECPAPFLANLRGSALHHKIGHLAELLLLGQRVIDSFRGALKATS